jgi:hypothetical protein
MNKERIIREFVRSEILNVLKESGPSKGFKKAAEELYDAELKQQKLKDKFIKSKSTAEKQLLKQELIAQHKLVQIAQQKFSNMLMIEPADDLDESVKKKRLNELELTTQTTGATPNTTDSGKGGVAGIQNLIKNVSNYEQFVSQLGSLAQDPKVQAFLNAGTADGDQSDDKFTATAKAIPVKNLRPTQNEIDVDGSLKWPLTKTDSLKNCLQKGAVTIKAPVVTYNGEFIIDGHHRWSQLYSMNKDGVINCIDLSGPKLKPIDVLKVVQLAIAAETGEVPSASVKEGNNLLKLDGDAIAKFVIDTITEDCVKVFNNLKGAALGKLDKNNIAGKVIVPNVMEMQKTSQPVAGAPKRNVMPQTDDATNAMQNLAKGVINFNEPFTSEQIIRKMIREIISELELTTQTTGKPASNNSAPADVPVEATENAEEGLEDGLKALQQFTKKVEESKSKSPRKKPVNEFEPISFTLGTLLSTPGILKGLGWVSDKISKPFLKDKQKGTIVGKALAHASHWLEDKYLGSIAAGLKAVYPETFPMEYAENNELGKAAKKVYMVMLMAAGVHAGMSAVNAHSLIIKSIEGGATLVKSAEAIELATALVEA